MKLYIIAFVWVNTHGLYKEYKVFANNEQEAIDYVVEKKEIESIVKEEYHKRYIVEARRATAYCEELEN